MTEIIYISPTCKQASEFIDRLMWELRKRGIYDFEICHEKMQIKTGKFIVTAIDIYWRPRKINADTVKYYIDKVSDYSPICLSDKVFALGILKEIKQGFREDAKEISERELIKILTEEQHDIHD